MHQSRYFLGNSNDFKIVTISQGEWTDATAGGCSAFDSCYINPKYHVDIPEKGVGMVKAVVEQPSEGEQVHIGFYLFIGDTANDNSLVGMSEYVNCPEGKISITNTLLFMILCVPVYIETSLF